MAFKPVTNASSIPFLNLKINLICFKVVPFFFHNRRISVFKKMVLVAMKFSAKQHILLEMHDSMILKAAFPHSPKWIRILIMGSLTLSYQF